jgi:DNA-binding beta-propeller fold protein YncE
MAAAKRLIALLAPFALAAQLDPALAQIAVSANDGKLRLENGKTNVVKDGAETVSLIDFTSTPPKSIAEIKVPTSIVGPPTSVAVAPNEEIALVTAAMKIDPADATKQIPDDTLTVIELGKQGGIVSNITSRARGKEPPPAYAPKVLATLKAGKGASGVSINKAGTLALVANRSEGTVSVFEIKGKTVTPMLDKIKLGDEKSGPSAVAFTPDGKTALVTRDGDNKISVLAIDGAKVTDTKREISAGLRPYGLDISAKGDFAMVANIGTGSGDSDTVSLIDLVAKPPRVVATMSVGQTPEGIKISPDGNYVAVSVMNGTNKAKDSPFYAEKGKLVVLRRQGPALARIADADIGVWCQGIVWSANSRRLAVQCAANGEIQVIGWNATKLVPAGVVRTNGNPSAIRTSEK